MNLYEKHFYFHDNVEIVREMLIENIIDDLDLDSELVMLANDYETVKEAGELFADLPDDFEIVEWQDDTYESHYDPLTGKALTPRYGKYIKWNVEVNDFDGENNDQDA